MTFNVQGWHHPGLDHLEELLLEQAPRLAMGCEVIFLQATPFH